MPIPAENSRDSTAGPGPALAGGACLRGSRRLAGLLPVVLVLVIHTAGRLATVCAPHRVDSLTYALAADRFWQADVSYEDLIPDKPPGQALLTGWSYRVLPGRPSRLTLVPIESAFLMGSYAVFYMLSRRLFGTRRAAFATVLFVLVHNLYNAIDTTTDGFNLNENYIALPILAAAASHLLVSRPFRAGLGRGLGLGLALTIKQTAAGLLLVFLVHDLWRSRGDRRSHWARLWIGTGLGLAVAGAPILVILASNGWLAAHLADLTRFSLPRVGLHSGSWPHPAKLMPLAPIAWLAAMALSLSSFRRQQGPATEIHAPGIRDSKDVAVVAFAWLIVESLVVWSLSNRSSHYYQQLAAPACLLAGWAMSLIADSTGRWSGSLRSVARQWVYATAIVLTFVAAIPLGRLASLRGRSLDPELEARVFVWAQQMEWLPDVIHQIRSRR